MGPTSANLIATRMSFKRRIILFWRLAKLVPKLANLEAAIPKLESLQYAIPNLEVIEAFLPRLGSLGVLLESITKASERIPADPEIVQFLERIKGIDLSIQSSAMKFETFERLIPHLESLKSVIEKLDAIERRMPPIEQIEAMASRLVSLDSAVSKIETLANPRPVTVVVSHSNGNGKHSLTDEQKAAIQERHEWSRLNLLSKFVNASEKARDIEVEWQRIQQDENDSFFAFQSLRGRSDSESVYLYKKGIGDGIRWVLERFS